MIEDIENSLNGGYKGLFGEVVDTDVYGMRDVEDIVSVNDPSFIHVKGHKRKFDFTPTIIFDLGANVGVFTRYCRRLFGEEVKIISVEPHPENFKYLEDCIGNNVLINKAIGKGSIYKSINATNGAAQCYLSKSNGLIGIDKHLGYELSDIPTITIKELFDEYIKEGDKIIVKMDIEGGENSILQDEESIQTLLRADYFTMEYHYFGITGEDVENIRKLTEEFLDRFKDTHSCELNHPIFHATKN